jgi:hypothetical protein
MDEPARQQAFVTALVTEHFVQAGARAATITESNGRAAIYLSAVSSGLVAFGFLAQAAPTAGWPPLMVRRRLHAPPQAPGSAHDRPLASPLQPAARTEQPPELALVEQRPGTNPDA